jgi:preprotein translocase subunit SecG
LQKQYTFYLLFSLLMQNPKGGGLSSSFGGGAGNQIMGAKKTTDFLEKATWTLAITLIVLSLVSNFAIPRQNTEEATEIKAQEQIDGAVIPNLPSAPIE